MESDSSAMQCGVQLAEELKKKDATIEDLMHRLAVAEARRTVIEARRTVIEARRTAAEADLAERDSQSVFQYFAENGKRLPKLRQTWTPTGAAASVNKRHQPIRRIHRETFGLIPLPDDAVAHTTKWSALIHFSEEINYATEIELQHLVNLFLEDMIMASKVDLKLTSYLTITALKADFWVISANGFPVGAVEVKKPDRHQNGVTEEMVLGQLFDYLMRIRTFHGVKNLFGIVTDFETWTICWPQDSSTMAAADDDCFVDAMMDPATTIKRELCVSKKYSSQDKEMAQAVVSVLMKMKSSSQRVDTVPLLSRTRSYIQLCPATWYWSSGITATELSFKPPASHTKSFYLLRDFHGGSDGRVWLACSDSGKLAVIKFFKLDKDRAINTNDKVLAQREMQRWRRCGFNEVFVARLAGRHGLIMPFGFHFKVGKNCVEVDDKWWISKYEPAGAIRYFEEFFNTVSQAAPATVLQNCIDVCVKKNLVHDDMEWRHVAIFPVIKEPLLCGKPRLSLKYCFIDLGRMTVKPTAKAAQEVMMTRKNILLCDLVASE
jgi:hypothetical protein